MRFAFRRDPYLSIPDNLLLSQRRLLSLLKRLKRDPDILREYNAIIQQQLKAGIVEVVESKNDLSSDRIHYLPHHAVIRRDKETGKLCVVYDASAKEQGPSLTRLCTQVPSFIRTFLIYY